MAGISTNSSSSSRGAQPRPPLVHALALALMATHEVDAACHREWRLLPVLMDMDEDIAQVIYVALHVPVFSALFAWMGNPALRWGMNIYGVVHGLSHYVYRNHPHNTLTSPLSLLCIHGAAATALLDLCVLMMQRRAAAAAAAAGAAPGGKRRRPEAVRP